MKKWGKDPWEMKMWGRWRGKGEKPMGDEEVREKPMEDEEVREMKRHGGKTHGRWRGEGDEEARGKECGGWTDERWDVREKEKVKKSVG
jgi:hypothetical protein